MPFSSWLKSTRYILPAKALRAHNQAHTISQLRASFSEGQSAPLESLTSFQPRLRCSWPEPNATMPPSPGMCQDTSWSSSYKAALATLQKKALDSSSLPQSANLLWVLQIFAIWFWFVVAVLKPKGFLLSWSRSPEPSFQIRASQRPAPSLQKAHRVAGI